MTQRAYLISGAAAISAMLFAFAFVAAPRSCQWGNEAYFRAGVAALFALFVLPRVFRAGVSLLVRIGVGLGLVVLGCAVWLAGLFAANFRIICTLF